ncbi:hypothetical protein LguiB_017401 [Lonicera macranthoides]
MEDSDQSKLFVGGICWETTDEALKEHFGKYGTVVGSVIAKDRNTGSPRGFAFVSFSDPSAVDEALLDSHNILGRTVDVKKARPRGEQNQNQQQSRYSSRNTRSNGNDHFRRTKKIFVGGLPANLTDQEFRNYFEKFGRITDVVVMQDNMTHRPRGFGFITFDTEDVVENVMQASFHELNGKLVEVKRAVPKEGNNHNSDGSNMQVGSVRGSNLNGFYDGNYPYYSPRYGVPFPGYGPPSAYGGVAGYPYGPGIYGGYLNGFGYGVASASPRSPFHGPAVVGVRGSPVPYGFYPPYWNGVGVMSVAPNGYNGFVGTGPNEKPNPFGGGDSQVDDTTAALANVDINSLASGVSYNGATSKQR